MTTLKDEIISRARVQMDKPGFKEHVERFLRSATYSKVSDLPAQHMVQFADWVLIPWESGRIRYVPLFCLDGPTDTVVGKIILIDGKPDAASFKVVE